MEGGSRLLLTLRQGTVTLHGTVVHIGKGPGGHTLLGVRFDTGDAQHNHIVAGLLDDLDHRRYSVASLPPWLTTLLLLVVFAVALMFLIGVLD